MNIRFPERANRCRGAFRVVDYSGLQSQRTVIYRRAAAENLRSNFLARFNKHFLAKPEDELFERIYTEDPGLYFSSLVQLAKVLKVEVGEAGAFDDRPRPREEALKRLEERAGADARKLFEAFLRKIDKLEAAALEAKG